MVLARAGVGDGLLVDLVRNKRTVFDTSADALALLARHGLSENVLRAVVEKQEQVQLNKNLTPFPTPKENGFLINTGLYKYVRHPIYSGIFLAAIGIAFYTSSYWQLVISFILLILFYYKSKYEESLLIETYKEYEEYKKVTRRFFKLINPFWISSIACRIFYFDMIK